MSLWLRTFFDATFWWQQSYLACLSPRYYRIVKSALIDSVALPSFLRKNRHIQMLMDFLVANQFGFCKIVEVVRHKPGSFPFGNFCNVVRTFRYENDGIRGFSSTGPSNSSVTFSSDVKIVLCSVEISMIVKKQIFQAFPYIVLSNLCVLFE